MNVTNPLDRWMKLGQAGFVVSIVYGPSGCGPKGARWSVDVMTPSFKSFERPFAAHTLEQCVEIAELEIAKRGWLI